MPARPERGWVSRCFYSEIRQQPVVGCRLAGVGQVAGQRNAYSWHGIPGKMAAALHTLNDRRRRIDFAVFGPGGGWLIVFDDYGYRYDHLVRKVKELNAKQRTNHLRQGGTSAGMGPGSVPIKMRER